MAGFVVDTTLLYGFMRRLLTPFNETDAFRLGLIDANGKRLRSPRTRVETNADRPFDRLILNLKRMIEKVGGGSITTGAIALLLLRESRSLDKFYDRLDLLQEAFDVAYETSKFYPNFASIFESVLNKPTPSVAAIAAKHNVSLAFIEAQLRAGIKIELEHTSKKDVAREIALDHLNEKPDYYTQLKKVEVREDVVTNSAGSGAIAGIGVGSQGEPGVKRFAGVRLYDVKSTKFHKAIHGKKKFSNFKHWVETEDADDIKSYAKTFPRRPILVRNSNNGVEMMFLRRGKSKSLSFHEAAGAIRYWVVKTTGSTDWRIIRTNADLRAVHPDWEIRGPYGAVEQAQAHRSVDRDRDDQRYRASPDRQSLASPGPATRRTARAPFQKS